MKLSLLAAALMALALTACDRPKQALPENSTTYGTRTEEGTTLDQERGPAGAEAPATKAPDDKVSAAPAAEEDEYSGQAVLPGHALDGNGNPLPPGQSAIPAGH
ncbi:hypothetical protein SAMN06298226_1593 [Nitrosovibrio sp. Nv4]|uniref:hypothetical protein n=1 Tax=Nitrosovibrio sp. Nv6 TaxID=1855340 RepID=UPI0008BBC7C2|nr:hypothetical protein [Nitrosovibrio sp. Nv6]SEO36614.1 hypothetical protein SAMN05216316_0058 [Nitrosovibrio sp. Nv6]SOD41298.1 hypothetical protein SAMN06298226_1593 [Nitrosovibrio sp. Nv4]